MPFKYLAKLIQEEPTRVDRLEERMRRMENEISKSMMLPMRDRIVRRGTEVKRAGERARSVNTSEGWRIPRRHEDRRVERGKGEDEIRLKEFGKDWVIEFECPRCGAVSQEGINHWNTRKMNGHTKYDLYLNCRNCGWVSDLLNIRAFERF